MTNWVADNLGGLDLPHYLPELASDRTDYTITFREQQVVKCSPCQVNRTPEDDQFYDPSGVRLMTAADLGLPKPRTLHEIAVAGMLEPSALYLRYLLGDAPYSFWLGADNG